MGPLNSGIFWIMPVVASHLEVYYKSDRLPTVLTAQQIVTDARWDSNQATLTENFTFLMEFIVLFIV